jgi:hypothetical protein
MKKHQLKYANNVSMYLSSAIRMKKVLDTRSLAKILHDGSTLGIHTVKNLTFVQGLNKSTYVQ